MEEKFLQRTHFCNKICCFSLLGISLSLSLSSLLSLFPQHFLQCCFYLHVFGLFVQLNEDIEESLKRVPFLTCGIKIVVSHRHILVFPLSYGRKKKATNWFGVFP